MAEQANKAVYESRPWLKYYLEGVLADVDIPEISVVDDFNQSNAVECLLYVGDIGNARRIAK